MNIICICLITLLILLFALIMAAIEINNSNSSKSKLLGYGSKGSEVMKIQHMLNFINIAECKFDHQIREDGIFYEETLREIKFFQISHQLTPDGLVGPETKSQIEMLYFTYKNDNRYGKYWGGLR